MRTVEEQAPSRAYDALAAEYDSQLAGTIWMRELLWKRYDAVFQAGDRVLDLGCGTGTDALHLARRGVRVTGIDASHGMIARARQKTEQEGLTALARFEVLDLDTLGDVQPGRFDGIISAFAALNTLPSLTEVAQHSAALLEPGGHMIVHLLNPWSLQEWLGLVLHGQWSRARALGRDPERTFVLGGVPVRHYLYPGQELYLRDFAPCFRLEQIYGLGIISYPWAQPSGPSAGSIRKLWDRRGASRGALPAPTHDQPRGRLARPPYPIAHDNHCPCTGHLMRAIRRVDEGLRKVRPFADWGRFVVLEMSRRP